MTVPNLHSPAHLELFECQWKPLGLQSLLANLQFYFVQSQQELFSSFFHCAFEEVLELWLSVGMMQSDYRKKSQISNFNELTNLNASFLPNNFSDYFNDFNRNFCGWFFNSIFRDVETQRNLSFSIFRHAKDSGICHIGMTKNRIFKTGCWYPMPSNINYL